MSKKLIIPTLLIIIIIVIAIIIGFIFNGNKSNLDSILSNAIIYNYSDISKLFNDNAAKATEYNGKYYVMYGTITEIEVDYLTLKNETSGTIKVYLDTEVLKNLNKFDQISIVGKVDDASKNPAIFKDAKILTQEEVEKYFIIDVTKEKGSRYPNFMYSSYKYDDKGLLLEYKVSGDSNGTYNLTYDENGNVIEKTLTTSLYGKDVFKYTYDENNNLLSENQIHYDKNGKETKNNIFDYTIEKNSNNQIVKKISTNRNSPNFCTEYTYEYDGNTLVKTIEYSHYSNNTYTSEYTYDSYGYKATQKTTGGAVNTIKYTYAIVSKR